MKKAIIGGFLTIVSSLWVFAIGAYVQSNLVTSWRGSRFWASASELGVVIPLALSLAVLALGLVMLCVEYVRKD